MTITICAGWNQTNVVIEEVVSIFPASHMYSVMAFVHETLAEEKVGIS
jgi:hypothetical protein